MPPTSVPPRGMLRGVHPAKSAAAETVHPRKHRAHDEGCLLAVRHIPEQASISLRERGVVSSRPRLVWQPITTASFALKLKVLPSMCKKILRIESIPAIVWGPPSESVCIFVHGKMSQKEEAEGFAEIAIRKGYQVLSFDLPEHGERKNKNYRCTAQNGVLDLQIISKFVVRR